MTRNFKSITSAQNPTYKDWMKLHKSTGIEKLGKLFVMGEKLVFDYLKKHTALEVVCAEGMPTEPYVKYSFPIYVLPAKLFQELDVLNTKSPLLGVKKPDFPIWDSKSTPSELEILVPFQDPGNVGGLIRTATAFGVKKIILLKEAASPFHPRAVRASSGTVFDASIFYGPSIQEINPEGTIGLDVGGAPLDKFRWSLHTRILIGEEGQGVPEVYKKNAVSIPIHPNCESLNATIAASIAIYSYREQFALKA